MLYNIVRNIEQLILRTFYSIKVSGLRNIPHEGGAILAINHASFLDSLFITAFVPRVISFLVYRKLYNLWYLNWLFRTISCIPTNGCTGIAVEYLRQGRLLGIFPEGKRSNNGNLQKGKTGTALFAIKTKVPVIPIGISGTWDAFPPGKIFPKLFRPINIEIGQPLHFSYEDNKEVPLEVLKESTEVIMKKIEELVKK